MIPWPGMDPATLVHREDSPTKWAKWPFHRVMYTEGSLALGDGAHPLGPAQCCMSAIQRAALTGPRMVPKLCIFLNRRNSQNHIWWLLWVRPRLIGQIICSIKYGKIDVGVKFWNLKILHKLWKDGRTLEVQPSSTLICCCCSWLVTLGQGWGREQVGSKWTGLRPEPAGPG